LLKTQAAMEETSMAARILASLIATAGYVRGGPWSRLSGRLCPVRMRMTRAALLAARLGSGINQNRSLLAELIGKDVTSEMPGLNWKWWSISCRKYTSPASKPSH